MSGVGGIVSGLETEKIITGLLASQQSRIDLETQKKNDYSVKEECYSSLSSLLSSFGKSISALADDDLWSSYTTTSSDESSLTATTYSGAEAGSYTFQVLQLATAAQYTSVGFSDSNTTAVSAGATTSISIDSGRANLVRETNLTDLNGGSGVSRGRILITDKSGSSATIDLSSAITVQDVLDAINQSGLEVEATVEDGALVITDTSGGSGTLKIANAGGSSTATDLGIEGKTSGTSLTGDTVYCLAGTTSLASLRGGLGVNNGTLGTITVSDGTSTWDVDLSSASTINGVISLIQSGTGGSVTASIGADGQSLAVQATIGGADLTITSKANANGTDNTTAEDLGIAGVNAGATLQGAKLLADMNSVQIASLSGVNGGGINGAAGDLTQALSSFTATINGTAYTFDLSSLNGDDSVDDILNALNGQAESLLGENKLTFSVNSTGNGIQVKNNTGYAVTFADVDGTTASDLGLTSVALGATKNCGDLDLQYVGRATLLSSLNGGNGVDASSFYIKDEAGMTKEIDIGAAKTVGEVIDLINTSGLDVTASINATGDGILLTSDTVGGSITVTEVSSGTAAADLGILGSSTTTLDGSFEVKIDIDTNDTLTDVMNKIASATDLKASIVNTGSSTNPYSLVLAASGTGGASDFLLDSDLNIFNFTKSSEGQDSVLLYGGGSNAITMTSSENTNDTAVAGLTLTLTSVSTKPVTITVSQDTDTISDAFQTMVDSYNQLLKLVNTLDQYVDPSDDTSSSDDSSTDAIKGLLFGDSATRKMMQSVTDLIASTRSNSGDLTSLFDLGISYSKGTTSSDDDTTETFSGALELDKDTLTEWLSTKFETVKDFMVSTKDVANINNGATVSAPAAASGSSLQNLVDGNTNTVYTAANSIDAGGVCVSVGFDGAATLSYLVIDHVDTATEPASDYALRDFTVQYLNAKTGEWTTLREVTGNTASKTVVGLPKSASVSGIRIIASDTNAADGCIRLAGIRAYASSGIAQSMETETAALTDTSTGFYATQYELMEKQVDDCQDNIDNLQDRYDAKYQQLYNKFSAMESTLSSLQKDSDYMTSVMSAWTSNDK